MAKDKKPEDMSIEEIMAANAEKTGKATPHTDEQIAAATPPAPEVAEVADAPAPGVPAPDPWVILQKLTDAIAAIAARPAGDQNSQALEVLTNAVMRLADNSIKGSELIVNENRKAFRPSNQVIPEISVFNRRGRDPQPKDDSYESMQLHLATLKPPLKCEMFFPWILEWASLTREEVMLLNLLEEGAYVVKRADRSKISLTVQIQYALDNKTPSRLFVNNETAFNQDNFKNMPPMPDMLRDMLKQHPRTVAQAAAAVLSDEEEEALIEAGEIPVTQ